MAIDPDAQRSLDELESTLRDIAAVLDVEEMKRSIRDLEDEAASPGLWDDPEHAQRVTSKLSYLQGELKRLESLQEKVDDLRVLFELAAGEDDARTFAEAQQELAAVRAQVGELEVRTLLSGPYDERGALVTVNAQAGGVDAADWTEMVLRMYTRWAERKGYPVEVYDTSYADGAGLKSATFAVAGQFAYGTLRGEHGTHRLVRISPFDSQNRRQTSFAGVDVAPAVELTDHIDVADEELRIDVYRSSGPGGQSVNTTDSAVRITHLPTGIVVSCQNERSQLQNRAKAMEVLKAKLLERKQQQEAAAIAGLRGEATTSWGTQIRNYVLHPYQMVKDLRTEVETSNTDGVLDGDLDGFIEAEIRWRRQQENGTGDD